MKLPNGLVLESMGLRASGGRVGVSPFEIAALESSSWQCAITESALADFLNELKPGGLHSFEVLASDGKIAVTATARVLVEIRATALCTLMIEDNSKVHVLLESVSVPMAHNLVEKQLTKLNPIIDTKDFPIHVSLDDIQVQDQRIHAEGTLIAGQVMPRDQESP